MTLHQYTRILYNYFPLSRSVQYIWLDYSDWKIPLLSILIRIHSFLIFLSLHIDWLCLSKLNTLFHMLLSLVSLSLSSRWFYYYYSYWKGLDNPNHHWIYSKNDECIIGYESWCSCQPGTDILQFHKYLQSKWTITECQHPEYIWYFVFISQKCRTVLIF